LLQTSFPLVAWVAVFFTANAVFANVGWYFFLRPAERSTLILRHPLWQTYAPLMRLLWFAGVPYGALLSGVATPEQFGLGLPDWGQAVADAAPIVVGAFIIGSGLLALLVWIARRNRQTVIYPAVQSRALISRPWGAAFILIESLCLQAQWTLYRTAAIELAGEARAAAGAALALVITGWALDPRWRSEAGRSGTAEDHYLIAALAIVSAVLYLSVTTFWILWGTQLLLWLGWLMVLGALTKPARRAQSRTTAQDE
jgi:hypothetical protein